jgi:16S rRNA C967 or C1407 C5-methylase (RsmB/RsmF family)
MDKNNPLADLAAEIPDGEAFLTAITKPFRRAVRVHPRRGEPTGWGNLLPVPWNPLGRFTAPTCDPGDYLDYHTGTCYPQDAASQVPVLLLAPQPGETIIDTCAAPGSKTTQIGLALGDTGLIVCCDTAAPRRQVLAENLARQGITCAVVTPMPLQVLGERHPQVADGVLVDAPCSGHELRSAKQTARMAERQLTILTQAALLVTGGGRLVYSTCTPYQAENEGVIQRFLATHPGWQVVPSTLPGCDMDLVGLGAIRLWPQRQGTEPFFACLLRAPINGVDGRGSLEGNLPPRNVLVERWIGESELHGWYNGRSYFIASRQAASCALPSEARGLILRHGEHDLEPWAAQALMDRGATTQKLTRAQALALWSGQPQELSDNAEMLVRCDTGAPIGVLTGPATARRLHMPSRLLRAGLI